MGTVHVLTKSDEDTSCLHELDRVQRKNGGIFGHGLDKIGKKQAYFEPMFFIVYRCSMNI